MSDAYQSAKQDDLKSEIREARELYFRLSTEMDELNLEIRSGTHGMVQPDGTHAIRNLGSQKRMAFERYQSALVKLTASLRESPRMARSDTKNGLAPTRVLPKPNVWPQLTARETEVLDKIAQGLTSKEIARELNISFKTAVTHRTHLMSKFDVSNVALLIRRAIASGHIKA